MTLDSAVAAARCLDFVSFGPPSAESVTAVHGPDRVRFSVHAHTPEELLVEAAEPAGKNPRPSPGTPRPTVGNPPTRK